MATTTMTETVTVIGEYIHPVIDEKTPVSDPWSRNYNQPPPLERLVPRRRPLIDLRPLLSEPGYSPEKLLQTHGFAVVKQQSPFVKMLQSDTELPEKAFEEIYHNEIKELFKKVTGAKEVFVTISALRQGKTVPSKFELPKSVPLMNQQGSQNVPVESSSGAVKLAGTSNLGLVKPIRSPHLDYTPLGARQSIRHHDETILSAATKSGVIALEDEICSKHNVEVTKREADDIVAEKYNDESLGPRYAAYSIWRPLKKIERDPITFSPRKETRTAVGEGVYYPYLNKIRGVTGDYLREYAMLGVQSEEPKGIEDASEWYYVSQQQPDEIMFIKQFDSAALGSKSEHAGPPWHGSPEIGGVHGDGARESLELRILAFW